MSIVDEIQVIDIDIYVVEFFDLWMFCMAASWGDFVFYVCWDDCVKEEVWFIGDTRLLLVVSLVMVGWYEYLFDYSCMWVEVNLVMWDAMEWLKLMDIYGMWVQMLYFNVVLFNALMIKGVNDQRFQLELVQVYNDYFIDFLLVVFDWLFFISCLLFWDFDVTIIEMGCCRDKGYWGIIFMQDFCYFGFFQFIDCYWDCMWVVVQEMGVFVNFYIVFGDNSLFDNNGYFENGCHVNYLLMGVLFFMSNVWIIVQLIIGGICYWFLLFKFVLVESGVGWILFVFDAFDWQWKNCGVLQEYFEYDLLFSEYFQRQIYGCWWFEREGVVYVVEWLGVDNIFYEIDFLYFISMMLGLVMVVIALNEYIEQVFVGLFCGVLQKILYDNAVGLYGF